MALISQQLYESTPAEKYATFFCSVYNDDTRVLRYTNAGHLKPIVIRDGKANALEGDGLVAGLLPKVSYEQQEFQIQPGDLIAIFSDGIPEAENALRQRYREVFGEEPRTTQKQQLIRRIGWKLQALSQGDISEAARRRALQIAQDREQGIHLPSSMVSVASAKRADARLPAAGTELRRQYRDRVVVAKALTDGFEYETRHYTSLSAVARAATGTRWNGWLFFGLAGDQAQQERA